MTLTFHLLTLKLVRFIARGVGNLPINFGVSGTLLARHMGQQLPDGSYDLATLTFDLGGNGACRWCGSSYSVGEPSLKFVVLPVRKILRIYCVRINRSGDFDLWPIDLYIGSQVTRVMGFHPTNFGLPRLFRSRVRSRHATDGQIDSWHQSSQYLPNEKAYGLQTL